MKRPQIGEKNQQNCDSYFRNWLLLGQVNKITFVQYLKNPAIVDSKINDVFLFLKTNENEKRPPNSEYRDLAFVGRSHEIVNQNEKDNIIRTKTLKNRPQ